MILVDQNPSGDLYLKPTKGLVIAIVAIICTMVILLPSLNLRGSLDSALWLNGTDSGVFQYGGWRVFHGEVPYRDFWDHKSPGIFFINALGYAIGLGNPIGIAIVEFFCILVTLVLLARCLDKLFGTVPTICTVLILTGVWHLVMDTGNWVELYSLLFSVVALYLAMGFLADNRVPSLARTFAISFFGALPILMKVNTAGLGVVICLLILISAWFSSDLRFAMVRATMMIAAVASIMLAFVLYFWSNNALVQAKEAIIDYNISYISTNADGTPVDRIDVYDVLTYWNFRLGPSRILFFIAIGLLISVMRLVRSRRSDDRLTVSVIAVFGFVVVVGLNLISGRVHPYYSIVAFAPAGILVASALTGTESILWWTVGKLGISKSCRHLSRLAMVLISLVSMGSAFGASIERHQYAPVVGFDERVEVAEYIQHETDAAESILIWGNSVYYYVATDHVAPTRFIYNYPLFMGSHQDKYWEELLTDIYANPPEIIVDTRAFHGSQTPGLLPEYYLDWSKIHNRDLSPGFSKLIQFVDTCYVQVGPPDVPSDKLFVFRRKANPGESICEGQSIESNHVDVVSLLNPENQKFFARRKD